MVQQTLEHFQFAYLVPPGCTLPSVERRGTVHRRETDRSIIINRPNRDYKYAPAFDSIRSP